MRCRPPLLMLLTITLAGCLPLSVNPLYTGEDDIVFDEGLLGTWDAGGDGGVWHFDADPDHPNHYLLTITDEDDRHALFRATVVQIGDRRFLDFEPMDVNPGPDMNMWFTIHLLPLRSFMRITESEQGYGIAPPDIDAVVELLQKDSSLVAHLWANNQAADNRLVLTADSAALQAFVGEHLDDETYFTDPMPLERVKEDQAPVGPAPSEESENQAGMSQPSFD